MRGRNNMGILPEKQTMYAGESALSIKKKRKKKREEEESTYISRVVKTDKKKKSK